MRLARALGQNGITVVSGLAKGIDVSAHMAALKSGYNTIAVIGTNLNQYYPAENKEVQQMIEEKGLVVSQFSPANKTERWFFPLRNGTMSRIDKMKRQKLHDLERMSHLWQIYGLKLPA